MIRAGISRRAEILIVAAAAVVSTPAMGQGVESRFPVVSGEVDSKETAPASSEAFPRLIGVDPAAGCVSDAGGLSEITATFDRPVLVEAGAFRLFDGAGAEIMPATITISPTGETVTLTLDPAIENRRVRLVVGPGVLAGDRPLDGEIDDPASPVFPSGNDGAGGEAVVLYRVLAGDANCDGVVDMADAQMIVSSIGLSAGDPGFMSGADFNGDGFVNVLDVAVYSSNAGAMLAPTDGVAPTATLLSPATTRGGSGAGSEIVFGFNEPMRFAALSESSLAIVDESGEEFAVSDATALDAQTARFTTARRLSRSETYRLSLSNALADLSGELLDAGSTSFEIGFSPQEPIFPARSFPVGFDPSFAAAGDLNLDGATDYVVTNTADGTISVLLGLSDGTFEDQFVIGVGSTPRGVVLSDLDGDGFLDAAVTLEGDDSVAVLYGTGTGDFGASARGGAAPLTLISVGDAPVFVASGLLDGDSLPDLAVVNQASGTVSIRLSRADRTFVARPAVPVSGSPRAAALGDLVGGEPLDLAVVDETSDTLTIYPGLGDGLFAVNARGGLLSFPTGDGPVYVGIGDLFDDKDLDLVVANRGGGSVTVITPSRATRGDGTQTIPAGAGTVYVGIGDLFDDKDLDLLTADSEDDQLTPIEQDPPGTLAPADAIPSGDRPVYTRIADVNGDGASDVVALVARDGVERRGALTVLLGEPGEGLESQERVEPQNFPLSTLALAPVNGDAALDLVVGYVEDSPGFEVLIGDGAGDFSTQSGAFGFNAEPSQITVGEVFGDGEPEILVATNEPAQVAIFEDDTKGGYFDVETIDFGTLSIVADVLPGFTGNEVIVSRPGSIDVFNFDFSGPFRGKGPQPVLTLQLDGGAATALAVQDFDGDGLLDIVAAGVGGDFQPVAIGRGDGGQIFPDGGVIAFVATTAARGQLPLGASRYVGELPQDFVATEIAVAEVFGAPGLEVVAGGNEIIDFRGGPPLTGGFVVFAGDEMGDYGVVRDVEVGEAFGGMAVADFTGDGLADVAASSVTDDEVLVFVATSEGSFLEAQRFETHVGPLDVRAGDINGDGAVDLAILNAGSDDVTLLFGTPEPDDGGGDAAR